MYKLIKPSSYNEVKNIFETMFMYNSSLKCFLEKRENFHKYTCAASSYILEKIGKTTIEKNYKSQIYFDDRKTPKKFLRKWFNDPEKLTYEKIIYKKNNSNTLYFNLWNPYTFQNIERLEYARDNIFIHSSDHSNYVDINKSDLLIQHIKKYGNRFFQFIKTLIQNPSIPQDQAVIVKDADIDFLKILLKNIYGEYLIGESKRSDDFFVGRSMYTKHSNKLVVFCDNCNFDDYCKLQFFVGCAKVKVKHVRDSKLYEEKFITRLIACASNDYDLFDLPPDRFIMCDSVRREDNIMEIVSSRATIEDFIRKMLDTCA